MKVTECNHKKDTHKLNSIFRSCLDVIIGHSKAKSKNTKRGTDREKL